MLVLPGAKNDPFNKGRNIVLPCINSKFCPLCVLKQYFLVRFHFVSAWYLSTYISRYHGVGYQYLLSYDNRPLSENIARARLKKMCIRCNIDPLTHTLHSLRIGAATWALQNNISADTVRFMGGWRSDSVHIYFRHQPEFLATVAKTLGPLAKLQYHCTFVV